MASEFRTLHRRLLHLLPRRRALPPPPPRAKDMAESYSSIHCRAWWTRVFGIASLPSSSILSAWMNPPSLSPNIRSSNAECRSTFKNADYMFPVVSERADFHKDLSLDNLDRVELIMAIEQEFSVEIPDDKADNLSCCADVVKYIAETQKIKQESSLESKISKYTHNSDELELLEQF